MIKIIATLCLVGSMLGQSVNQETIAWGERRNTLMHIRKPGQDARINAAMRDWRANKPLPGLPSLKRPVRVKVGSYLCNTEGELLNPNVDVLLKMHGCMVTSHTVLVRVLQPTNMNDYVTDYYNEIVEVTYQSGDVADANVFTAWVPIPALSNLSTPQ